MVDIIDAAVRVDRRSLNGRLLQAQERVLLRAAELWLYLRTACSLDLAQRVEVACRVDGLHVCRDLKLLGGGATCRTENLLRSLHGRYIVGGDAQGLDAASLLDDGLGLAGGTSWEPKGVAQVQIDASQTSLVQLVAGSDHRNAPLGSDAAKLAEAVLVLRLLELLDVDGLRLGRSGWSQTLQDVRLRHPLLATCSCVQRRLNPLRATLRALVVHNGRVVLPPDAQQVLRGVLLLEHIRVVQAVRKVGYLLHGALA